MVTIDLNADMGEGYGAYDWGADDILLRYVSSANIACGFHAGDPHTMRKVVDSCLKLGVAIGAHPGLPDRLGFGRRAMAVTPRKRPISYSIRRERFRLTLKPREASCITSSCMARCIIWLRTTRNWRQRSLRR